MDTLQMAMELASQLASTLDTWEVVCYDSECGDGLICDADIYTQPHVGYVIQECMEIVTIKSIDIPAKVCHASIKYVGDATDVE